MYNCSHHTCKVKEDNEDTCTRYFDTKVSMWRRGCKSMKVTNHVEITYIIDRSQKLIANRDVYFGNLG